MESLEKQLEEMSLLAEISREQFEKVGGLMGALKVKHAPSYEHSQRVGILGTKIALYIPGADPKALFYSGSLHDIGKLVINIETLTKTHDFGPEDMEKMKAHVMHSYKILEGIYPFTAEIVLRHHYFQTNGYPEELPELSIPVGKGTEMMINYYARLLSLADSYDAASTRKNNKFGKECKALTPEQVKKIMITSNSDQVRLIENLYDEGIFIDH